MRTYSDQELARAVAASHSWRGVLRELGLNATSGGAIRSVRTNADRLSLDHSHFRGNRGWTVGQLQEAIARSRTWHEVGGYFPANVGRGTSSLRGHAARLGIDSSHLENLPAPLSEHPALRPQESNLARAGSLLAAAWFELCGCSVSWPLEPCRYDLLVSRTSTVERIQVKTTTLMSGSSWRASLSSNRNGRRTYRPDEIDQFFVIDGDRNYYLIPLQVVGGLTAIHLSAYASFRVTQ